MTRTIGITGATGQIGGRVLGRLAGGRDHLRLIVRDAARAPQGCGEIAVADYGDARAIADAVTGLDALLLVSAVESPDRLEQHRTVIAAAAAAGVRHIVYTSFLSAAPDATFTFARDHWATEQMLAESGIPATILRDSFYLDVLPHFAGQDGVIRGPGGTGRVGAVAREDVARVAAVALADPDAHAGKRYELTGPEALSFAEIAQIASEVTGREITFHDETVEEAYDSRASYGAPRWQLDAWISTYTAIAQGELDVVTDDVARVTGVAPLSLAELLRLPEER